jgi:hypothetical protein
LSVKIDCLSAPQPVIKDIHPADKEAIPEVVVNGDVTLAEHLTSAVTFEALGMSVEFLFPPPFCILTFVNLFWVL